MNTYTATQKFVRMTPRKLRLIADSIRKMTPAAAIEVLPYSPRFAADPVLKVVKTAVANARQAGADESKLIFSEVQISEGPALKRGYQVSRGQWHPFKKKMAHIRVSVVEREEKAVKTAEKKEETAVEEKAAVKKTVKKEVKAKKVSKK